MRMSHAENKTMNTNQEPLPALVSGALFGLPADRPPLGELIGPGICDFCDEQSPQLRAFDRAPAAGLCYCRKCAPLSETDADWPNN
jgi:hypothetical protein